jgi:hypothetical protein
MFVDDADAAGIKRQYYTVTVTLHTTETREGGGEWEVVGHVPISQEEVSKKIYGQPEDYKGKTVPKMGYTPKIEKEVNIERQILEARVAMLDLKALIRAIYELNTTQGGSDE